MPFNYSSAHNRSETRNALLKTSARCHCNEAWDQANSSLHIMSSYFRLFPTRTRRRWHFNNWWSLKCVYKLTSTLDLKLIAFPRNRKLHFRCIKCGVEHPKQEKSLKSEAFRIWTNIIGFAALDIQTMHTPVSVRCVFEESNLMLGRAVYLPK